MCMLSLSCTHGLPCTIWNTREMHVDYANHGNGLHEMHHTLGLYTSALQAMHPGTQVVHPRMPGRAPRPKLGLAHCYQAWPTAIRPGLLLDFLYTRSFLWFSGMQASHFEMNQGIFSIISILTRHSASTWLWELIIVAPMSWNKYLTDYGWANMEAS